MSGRWDHGVAAEVEDRPLVSASQSLSSIYAHKPLQLRSTTGWREPFVSDMTDLEMDPDVHGAMLTCWQPEEERWSPLQRVGARTAFHLALAATRGSEDRAAGGGGGGAGREGEASGYLYTRAIQSHIMGPARLSRLLNQKAAV